MLFKADLSEAKLRNLNEALQVDIQPLNLNRLRLSSHGSEWSGIISEQNVQDLIDKLRSYGESTTNPKGPKVGNNYSYYYKARK